MREGTAVGRIARDGEIVYVHCCHLFVGDDSLEGQCDRWSIEHLKMLFHQMSINQFRIHLLVLHEQMGYIAATKLVWTAVILNGSKVSAPLTNGRAF